MTRGLNKVMIIGNIGRDPELRYTPSGKPVTSFSLASSRSWIAPDGERREETEWFNVVAWGNLAEICNQKLAKSQQVYVEGRLQTRSWEDDRGQRHFRTEIVANEMIILGPRDRNNARHDYNNHEETLALDLMDPVDVEEHNPF
ncbi:MAG: single-stranded DNA-binding protein [Anaerolineae bacterium]|jgi:single-strand DNA-binding protein|nr:single-stranded DNA-binding protein [Anaerolineales bacterium]MCQ3973673.1 single-stranded DNA-binding protein [Anaerolineae bacterium]